jgi:tRNA(adenine34) deaminase
MGQKENDLDQYFMSLALEEAHRAAQKGEVPVGAVLVKEEKVIARAYNRVEELQEATAHAELLCIQGLGASFNNWRLLGATLYVTLEPCSMCLGALLLARIKRVVWGASDIRHGACGSWVNLLETKHPTHTLEMRGGVLADESASLLKQFFKKRREVVSELRCR